MMKKIIQPSQIINFNIERDGLYAFFITAVCNQGQDLRLEIDSVSFREVPAKDYVQKYNVPAAWNGDKLKGLSQTNVFILNLRQGAHQICFFKKQRQLADHIDAEMNLSSDVDDTLIENWYYQRLGEIFGKDDNEIVVHDLPLNITSQIRDRQPWINIILKDLPMKSIDVNVDLEWRRPWDGDDIKLVIDGRIRQGNAWFHDNWLFSARPSSNTTEAEKQILLDLNYSDHTIEFWADQEPMIKSIRLNFNDQSVSNKYTDQQKHLNQEMEAKHEYAQRLDCYIERYGENNKPALIFYDVNYHQDSSFYEVYFWNAINKSWDQISLYGDENYDLSNHTKADFGINIEAPQGDDKSPLSSGWHAFYIGTSWYTNYDKLLTDFLLASINSYPNDIGEYGDVSNIDMKQDAYNLLNWHHSEYWQVYKIKSD